MPIQALIEKNPEEKKPLFDLEKQSKEKISFWLETIIVIFLTIIFFFVAAAWWPLKTEASEKIETANGPIQFLHSDENANETFIIKTDRKIYSGWDSAENRDVDIYFSVENLRPAENGYIKFLLTEKERLVFIEKYTPVAGTKSVPETKIVDCPKDNSSTVCWETIFVEQPAIIDSWTKLDLENNFSIKNPLKKETPIENLDSKLTNFYFPNGTTFFKARINYEYTPIEREFFIEVLGDNNGYGLLDPGIDDEFTVALLHFNGTNSSTVFTDESGKTWAGNGNAQLDETQKKFGSAGLLLDGTGDYVSTTDSADFDFGTDDFTIDGWVKWNGAVPNTDRLVSGGYYGSGANDTWTFGIGSGWGAPCSVDFAYYNGTGFTEDYGGNFACSANTWYHWALVRDGANVYSFFGGTTGTTWLVRTWNMGAAVAINTTIPGVQIGARMNDASTAVEDMKGWIDEVRISKGKARWITAFETPSEEYGPEEEPPATPATSTVSTSNFFSGFINRYNQPLMWFLVGILVTAFLAAFYKIGLSVIQYFKDKIKL